MVPGSKTAGCCFRYRRTWPSIIQTGFYRGRCRRRMLVCDALPESSCRGIPGTERRSFSGVGFRGGRNDFPAVLTHRPIEAIAGAEHADTQELKVWENSKRRKHLSRLLLQFCDKYPCAPRRPQPWWRRIGWGLGRAKEGGGRC